MAPNSLGLYSKIQGLCSDPTINHFITAPPSVGQMFVCVPETMRRWFMDSDTHTLIGPNKTKKQKQKERKEGRSRRKKKIGALNKNKDKKKKCVRVITDT